jgi:hypothetical protein
MTMSNNYCDGSGPAMTSHGFLILMQWQREINILNEQLAALVAPSTVVVF